MSPNPALGLATLEPPRKTKQPRLSLALIVKNEGATVGRVLACARTVCDELVVVDTGSTDGTVDLARAAGAKVYSFPWIDDFAAARNFAFEQCTGEWIMWLDADDVLAHEDQQKLLTLKDHLHDGIDGVFLSYQISFSAEGACSFSTLRERLIRRSAGLRWEYPVHECIALPYGRSCERADIAVQHRPLPEKQLGKVNRNLNILQEAVEQQGDRRPRNLFYFANELKDHGQFHRAVPIYQEYLLASDLAWERYWALLHLARCFSQMGEPEKARQAAMRAILLDSQRAEAYVWLGICEYDRRSWEQAIPYFQSAALRKKPAQGFVDDDAYSWQPHDYLSICYANLARWSEAIETTLLALPGNPHKSRLLKNLHWLVDQL